MIWHQLNRRLDVHRAMPADDSSGGQTRNMTKVGHVYAKVSQQSARERTVAAQTGAEHSRIVHLAPDADVHRGDELRGRGQTFRVLDTTSPSADGVYLRADCELIQPEEVD